MPVTIKELPSQEEINYRMDYEPETGILKWANPRKGRASSGQIAGNQRENGYWIVCFNKKKYYAHRLIWKYFHGTDPMFIDHIDGDRSNNRISNLRSASWSENQRNKERNSRNTSGFKGVVLHKPTGRWTAKIRKDGKITSLKYHDTAEEASEAYIKASKEIHGEFAIANRPSHS